MQAWKEFLDEQQKSLGKEVTDKWLRSLKLLHFDACNLYLEANDSFQMLWFEEHIRAKVKKELLNNNNRPIKVHLSIAEESPLVKVKKEKQPPPNFIFKADDLKPEATFDSFIIAEENRIAYQLLTRFELGVYNPIYLYGPSGSGKTHLLMATATQLKQKGYSVLYVRAETFKEHFVSAIRSAMMQEFRKTYRHADILLIDDVHLFAHLGATQEEFFHTFNTLHIAKKQILLSARVAPQFLTDIEERLMSRFEWGLSLSVGKLNVNGLKELIKRQLDSLPLDTINFLSEQFEHNIFSLLKALKRLPSSVPLETLLSDLIMQQKQIALNPNKIIRSVADVYGIRVDDILGKAQTRDSALPRQIAMYLCRNKLKMPYLKIGRVFFRDHSTVMTSVKQIQKKIDAQDPEVHPYIAEILRRLV